MQRLKTQRGGLLRQKATPPRSEETYNKRRTFPPNDKIPPGWQNSITREAQLAGLNRTANHLPEIRVIFCPIKIPVSPLKLPFHPPFEILHLPAGSFRSDARRKPFPFDAPFAAGGDMATVTWSNLSERLKRMGCGVNFKADA